MDRVLYPLAKDEEHRTGGAEPAHRRADSDHVPFDEAGVPASGACRTVANYEKDASFAGGHAGSRALG